MATYDYPADRFRAAAPVKAVVVTKDPSRGVTPSARRIERHLEEKGSISPMEALIVYGESRLARCIHELRENGAEITTEMKTDERGHRYGRYSLAA
jgi:hypothetical protein